MRGQSGITLIELMIVVVIVAMIAGIAITVYQNLQQKTRLAADQGVLAAMRSAIAVYYGQHNGTFPGSPGNYVLPSPPVFRCSGLTYSYDTTRGELRITSTNTVGDCS